MSAQELLDHLKSSLPAIERDEITPQGQLAVHVTRAQWHAAADHLRRCPRCNFSFFTFLTAVDMEDAGFEIVAHVYSPSRMQSVNLKMTIARTGESVPTLSDLWRGANWHEREMWELFGIDVEGHPHLVKLLLPEEFEGHPLRKEFLLMTREAKEWPGAKEPEEAK